ncbi:hypothetical protein P4O66_008852 [Electrophorus voltai]|uniref:Uncharacterized protein n=1 Tax=Electrophorus voltai TaxID=2609070 RepID=A0AAD8ZDH4_9TELE|nr:hypothetical protein P4O66_008852 [Electrophorus voltai]
MILLSAFHKAVVNPVLKMVLGFSRTMDTYLHASRVTSSMTAAVSAEVRGHAPALTLLRSVAEEQASKAVLWKQDQWVSDTSLSTQRCKTAPEVFTAATDHMCAVGPLWKTN